MTWLNSGRSRFPVIPKSLISNLLCECVLLVSNSNLENTNRAVETVRNAIYVGGHAADLCATRPNRLYLLTDHDAGEEEDNLAEGIERLARVIRSLQDEQQQGNYTAHPTTAQDGAGEFK